MPDSSIPKFFEKSRKERLDVVANFANLGWTILSKFWPFSAPKGDTFPFFP